MDSSFILVIELIRLSDVLNVGCEGKREVKDRTQFLEIGWLVGVAHLLR